MPRRVFGALAPGRPWRRAGRPGARLGCRERPALLERPRPRRRCQASWQAGARRGMLSATSVCQPAGAPEVGGHACDGARARHDVGCAGDELGQRVHHDVGAPARGRQQHRAERVVHHELEALRGMGRDARSLLLWYPPSVSSQPIRERRVTARLLGLHAWIAPSNNPIAVLAMQDAHLRRAPSIAGRPCIRSHLLHIGSIACKRSRARRRAPRGWGRTCACATSASRGRSATTSVGLEIASVYSACGLHALSPLQRVLRTRSHGRAGQPGRRQPDGRRSARAPRLGPRSDCGGHGVQVGDVDKGRGDAALGREERLEQRKRAAWTQRGCRWHLHLVARPALREGSALPLTVHRVGAHDVVAGAAQLQQRGADGGHACTDASMLTVMRRLESSSARPWTTAAVGRRAASHGSGTQEQARHLSCRCSRPPSLPARPAAAPGSAPWG